MISDKQKDSILFLLYIARDILVKQFNPPVKNAKILESIITTFLEKNGNKDGKPIETVDLSTFIQLREKDTDKKNFLTVESSLKRLVKVVVNHTILCKGDLTSKKITEKGHVAIIRFNCSIEKP